jgi:hypothetical protein
MSTKSWFSVPTRRSRSSKVLVVPQRDPPDRKRRKLAL